MLWPVQSLNWGGGPVCFSVHPKNLSGGEVKFKDTFTKNNDGACAAP